LTLPRVKIVGKGEKSSESLTLGLSDVEEAVEQDYRASLTVVFYPLAERELIGAAKSFETRAVC